MEPCPYNGGVRRLGLVLTVLALLLIAVPAQGAAPLQPHAVPGTGFSISFPATWKSIDYRQAATTDLLNRLVRENPTMATLLEALRSPNSGVKLFAFDPKITSGFATNVNLVVDKVPAGTTPAAYAAAASGQLTGVPNVIRPIRRQTVKLPVGSSVRLQYGIRFTLAGKRIVTSTTQYVIVRGTTAYIVTFTTLPRLLATYTSLIAATARSIRVA
jgi:hypothetical protein